MPSGYPLGYPDQFHGTPRNGRPRLKNIPGLTRMAMDQALVAGESRTDLPAFLAIEAVVEETRAELERWDAQVLDLQSRLGAVAASKTYNFAETALARSVLVDLDSLLINPRGFFVYFLWGSAAQILYVGQSQTLLFRLSQHLRRPWASEIEKITVRRCETAADMKALEKVLINEMSPPYNVQWVR